MIKKENYLTVKQLRETLNKFDESYDDNIVILSNDSEGNECKTIDKNSFITTDFKFVPSEHGWSGDIYVRQLTNELIECGYNEEDLTNQESLDCIILFPYN